MTDGRRYGAGSWLAALLLSAAACRGGGAASETGGASAPGPAASAVDAASPAAGDVMHEPVAEVGGTDGTASGASDATPVAAADSDPAGPPADAAATADSPGAAEPTDVAPPPADASADGEAPPENRVQGERPGPASAEELARRLLAAIVADDPAPVTELVFPVGPFSQLKDLPDPAAYQRRLVRWFEEDLHTKHGELGGIDALEFRSFRFGRCEWVPKWGEGNLIPYWSCRRNRITASTGTREVEVEIRVLINWGQEWYVTHLGPVRR